MLKSWWWVGWVGGVVAPVIIESAPVPIGLGFGFLTGLGLGLGLRGPDLGLGLGSKFLCFYKVMASPISISYNLP